MAATDWAAVYRENVDAVSALAGALDADDLALRVPATPDWTVQQVLAHLAGGPPHPLAGRVGGPPPPPTGGPAEGRAPRPPPGPPATSPSATNTRCTTWSRSSTARSTAWSP